MWVLRDAGVQPWENGITSNCIESWNQLMHLLSSAAGFVPIKKSVPLDVIILSLWKATVRTHGKIVQFTTCVQHVRTSLLYFIITCCID